MQKITSVLLLITLATLASTALAREEEQKLAECVDLPATYQATRSGSQYLLIKDNDDYFRIDVGSSCNAIALSSNVTISTQGENNRICPAGTQVASKHSRCNVREITRIAQTDYDRNARKRR